MARWGSWFSAEIPKKRPLSVGALPEEAAVVLDDDISLAIGYFANAKTKFRQRSTSIRLAAIFMSGSSTVILGLQNLDFWASVGFSLTEVISEISAC